MKNTFKVSLIGCLLLATGWYLQAQGTAFTYQGRLNSSGSAANGSYDVAFTLYGVNVGGSAVAGPVTNAAVAVSNGLFTTTVDLGNAFTGADRWLELAVRTNGNGAFSTLVPRQPLTPTPYAVYSANAGYAAMATTATTATSAGSVAAANVTGALNTAQLPAGVITNGASGANISGTFTGNGANVTNVNAASLGGYSNTGFWKTNGNSSADPASGAFIGTTDFLPLEIKVNGQRALRLEPSTFGGPPNVILGSVGNSAGIHIMGATIGGGDVNIIQNADYSTIGGGDANLIQNNAQESTIGGGDDNQILNNASASTVGGGSGNLIGTDASFATISGGEMNTIQDVNNINYISYSTIGGGSQNTIHGSVSYAMIGGGEGNEIMDFAVSSTIGGGYFNKIQTNSPYSSIGGGNQNIIRNGAKDSTIGGGVQNQISSYDSTIGGGNLNQIQGSSSSATISGGNGNTILVGDNSATIGGGSLNSIKISANESTIAGGLANTIQPNAHDAVIGGGGQNTIQTNATYATLGGGYLNTSGSDYATVPGGAGNTAGGQFSFAAGHDAKALHDGAFVWADSPGGGFSSTGNDQFCIRARGGVRLDPLTSQFFGSQTRQMLNLWGTNYGIGVQASSLYFRCDSSTGTDGFIWYKGGVHNDAYANAGGGTELMHLIQGALYVNGTFVSASDRNLKENFKPVSAREMLDKVAALPISRWNYKQDTSSEHVGPMAQDFYAAFSVGPDNKHITVVDEGGVALAAIQGLNQKLEDQKVENARLKEQNDTLAQRLNELEAAVKAITQK